MAHDESEKHIIRRWSLPVPFGRVHFIDLDIFDPQLFLELTPPGSPTEKYHARTSVNGVSVVYSHDLPEPATELLFLSVSGGPETARQAIIDTFGEYLGKSAGRLNWHSVSPLGISPDREMYIWRVDLKKVQ